MATMADFLSVLKPIQKERSKKKRATNREQSAQLLSNSGIEFVSRNEGAHLIVTAANGHTFDFWPGTGRWRMRGSTQSQRGVRSLIQAVESIIADVDTQT